MEIKERIKQYLDYKGISDYRFEKELFLSKGYINKAKNPTSDVLIKMCGIYTDISTEWLLRGEGSMLKSSNSMIGSNQGDNNKIEYNNGGSIGVGNTINVALPEAGSQKIIKPDGGVEISHTGSSNNELEHKNELLITEITHLKDNIIIKDELISSLKETIELLKHRQ